MRLLDYISERYPLGEKKRPNVSAFARELGVPQGTVRRWLLPRDHRDYRSPRRAAEKIEALTEGRVTPNDLLSLAEEQAA